MIIFVAFQFRKTKVFLKYWHIDQLSDLLLKMAKSAVHMQRGIDIGDNRLR